MQQIFMPSRERGASRPPAPVGPADMVEEEVGEESGNALVFDVVVDIYTTRTAGAGHDS
jgi:hypothetical protein